MHGEADGNAGAGNDASGKRDAPRPIGQLFGRGAHLRDPRTRARYHAILAAAQRERGRLHVEKRRAGEKWRCPDCGTWRLTIMDPEHCLPLAEYMQLGIGVPWYHSDDYEPDKIFKGHGKFVRDFLHDIARCWFLPCMNQRCRVFAIVENRLNDGKLQVVLRQRKYTRPNYKYGKQLPPVRLPNGKLNPNFMW